MPPSGARCSCTSSMKLRMRKMPRPLDLSRFSGSSGSATVSGSKPSPWSRTRIVSSGTSASGGGLELDEHVLGRVVAVAVLDGVDHRLADRDADPVQRVVVEADVARHVVADHLDEIEHLERAGELEPDDVLAVSGHAASCRTQYHPFGDVKARGQIAGRVRSDRHAADGRRAVPARRLRGRLRVPGDKSISHRYALLAALAEGRSTPDRILPQAPTAGRRSPACARWASTSTERPDGTVTLLGRGFGQTPFADLARSTPAIPARRCGCWPGCWRGSPFRRTLVGDASLSRRPMRRVIEPLEQMGARIDADRRPRAADDSRRAAARRSRTAPRCRARR